MRFSFGMGSGRATCRLCNKVITKGVPEIYGNLGSGNYGYHYHLRKTDEGCRGFIKTCWETLDAIVSSLTEAELADLGLEIRGN